MLMKLVNIRMDEDLKKEMEIVCNDLGINITTAFTIFAKKLTREKRIPFSVSIDPFYSTENIKALQESVSQVNDGKVITKTLEELEANVKGIIKIVKIIKIIFSANLIFTKKPKLKKLWAFYINYL